MDRFIALTCRNRADSAGLAFGSPLVPIAKGFGVFDPHRLFRKQGQESSETKNREKQSLKEKTGDNKQFSQKIQPSAGCECTGKAL